MTLLQALLRRAVALCAASTLLCVLGLPAAAQEQQRRIAATLFLYDIK